MKTKFKFCHENQIKATDIFLIKIYFASSQKIFRKMITITVFPMGILGLFYYLKHHRMLLGENGKVQKGNNVVKNCCILQR